MAKLNIRVSEHLRASRWRGAPLRERVHIEAPPGWGERVGGYFKILFTVLMFAGGFIGGFVVVLYAVQLPGLPRFL